MMRWIKFSLIAAMSICAVIGESFLPLSSATAEYDLFRNPNVSPSAPSRPPAPRSNPPVSTGPIRGRFKIVHVQIKKEYLQQLNIRLQDSGALNYMQNNLNNLNLNLPADVPVIFGECGEANAFYSPSKRQIIMCIDLVHAFVVRFHEDDPDASLKELLDVAFNVTSFVVLHEMGHAIIDIFDIPVTGREEDAVDEMAAILLLEQGNAKSEQTVLQAAISFLLAAEKNENIRNLPYWGEHSLDQQRFFSLLCLVYGSNPDKYSHLVERNILPESRAKRCPSEYTQKLSSWNRLLAPHINNNPVVAGNQPQPQTSYQPDPGLLW
ncbi:DUF4344 domain-containing metallopeptidase [Roseofilum sp. BLCC_M91]|uniref:DUF4344 domain-containing metallopeptidase n=1 Tax=Roseofilum halophilum BLCC-M91 TaxID=3022259 RepID=A0ABT7BPM4_9CYAN|nr:DUF4344 domain-containing metallopeptidase [Roseofilum halophilum]MDJ1180441.1 DUF4344 domain-containing metallopeptidase [Roseofilum halophilum BLCC-M91]